MYFADEPEHVAILREMVRRFVAEEMPAAKVRQWDREHRFPPELHANMQKNNIANRLGLRGEESR